MWISSGGSPTPPQLPRKRDGSAAVRLSGKIYVFGGQDAHPNYNFEDILDIYDETLETWSTGTAMPALATGRTGACVYNSEIYIAHQGTLRKYDPVGDSYTVLASPNNSGNDCWLGVYGSYLYLLTTGGWIERYDPALDTWTELNHFATPRANPGVAIVGDKLYMIGGFEFSTYMAECWAYSIPGDTWTEVASMPTARVDLAAIAIDGLIYAVGGRTGSSTYSAKTEVYDPVADSWITEDDKPAACGWPTLVDYASGFHALGGYIDGDNLTAGESFVTVTPDAWANLELEVDAPVDASLSLEVDAVTPNLRLEVDASIPPEANLVLSVDVPEGYNASANLILAVTSGITRSASLVLVVDTLEPSAYTYVTAWIT